MYLLNSEFHAKALFSSKFQNNIIWYIYIILSNMKTDRVMEEPQSLKVPSHESAGKN